MSEWKEYKLGKIAKRVTSGGTPSTKNDSFYGGDIPWLNTKEINFNRIKKTEKFITEEGLNNSSAKWIDKNSVIVAMYGATAAKVCINKIPLTTNQACCNLAMDSDLADYEFVFYNLCCTYKNLENIAIGAAQQNLSVGVISDFEIYLPPLPEQRAIASILSSLDDKIDLLHRQNVTLEKMAETLFRQWFMEEAKEEWKMESILDFAKHHKIAIQPQQNPSTIFYHYSIPAFDNNKNPVVELGKSIQSNKYAIPENCILFSKLNPHKDKRIWLLQNEVKENSICSTEFQIVLPKKKEYLFFLYGWLSLKENYNEIASGVGGTSESHQRIDPASIFNFQCPKPDEKYILKYNELVSPMYLKIQINQTQIRTLTQLRDLLLPKLMSGEVRYNNLKIKNHE
jgi:type I restriction enzyme S subunit